MRRFWLILVCAFLAAGPVACGDTSDDDDPANNDPNPAPGPELDCTAFEACGGDIVGNWDIVGMCLPPSMDMEDPFDPSCPEATLVSASTVSGSFDFKADNTYLQNSVQTPGFRVVFPKSCHPDCSVLNAGGTNCNDTGDACDCVTVLGMGPAPVTMTVTGAWSVEGNTLTLTPNGDDQPNKSTICVSGNSARLEDIVDEDEGEQGEPSVLQLQRK